MDLAAVRDAYASVSQQYIGMFAGGVADDENDEDAALVRRHLTGLPGPVLDLGCGPGHWSAYLHALGADVTGVDMVPEFVAHARVTYPGIEFRLGPMADVDLPPHSAAGILAWYSTIHVPPPELDGVLAGFRRLLAPSGVLVIGFFDSEDGVSGFDHKVTTAYRWPVDALSRRLTMAGFTEVERVCRQLPERPDRRYAAIAGEVSAGSRTWSGAPRRGTSGSPPGSGSPSCPGP